MMKTPHMAAWKKGDLGRVFRSIIQGAEDQTGDGKLLTHLTLIGRVKEFATPTQTFDYYLL